jgi:hypothetical protein
MYLLIVDALKSAPIWQMRSIRYMFRLDNGTQLDWIFQLADMLVQAQTVFW